MKRVIVFGSFDPLHAGHVNFFEQAKALGDHLTVVVAHDSALLAHKHRTPYQSAEARLAAVIAVPEVDRALIGNKQAGHYDLLGELDFEIVALGYDQEPDNDTVQLELDARGKKSVTVVRLKPYQAHRYKSSRLRGDV